MYNQDDDDDEYDFSCEVFLDDGGAPPAPTDNAVIFPLPFMLGAS